MERQVAGGSVFNSHFPLEWLDIGSARRGTNSLGTVLQGERQHNDVVDNPPTTATRSINCIVYF